MSKYIVEVGGYVSCYRQRKLTIYADSIEEAEEKALNKYSDLVQNRPGDMLGDCQVNEIMEV